MTTCKITSLGDAQENPFRKKRSPDDVIEQMPVLKVDTEIVPFKDYISKVRFSKNIYVKNPQSISTEFQVQEEFSEQLEPDQNILPSKVSTY